ncbi:hypothetical protein J8Z28_07585 [Pseudoalteromonas sp. SCSIO 43088]|uniref:hypothetical protein n=1 Tax=Pseudoalteromonas sp. SCSIO 43088 TaxID=2822846 RepID=UPI00202B9CCF|nr:hypothetical protein [Pseudoalteromonas sp. SCSIO 43088]URQ87693.1 hypothetical protein J8Z28_07585 [Pseudoalteromonas sp. SCSIO 43088]
MKPNIKRRAHNWFALNNKEGLSMAKNQYKCQVDGVLGKVGKAFALCGKSGVNGKCSAHGNYKCEHKMKVAKKKVKA